MKSHDLTHPDTSSTAWDQLKARVQDTYNIQFETREQDGHEYIVLPAAGEPL